MPSAGRYLLTILLCGSLPALLGWLDSPASVPKLAAALEGVPGDGTVTDEEHFAKLWLVLGRGASEVDDTSLLQRGGARRGIL